MAFRFSVASASLAGAEANASNISAADDFGPRVPGLFFLVAFGEDQYPHLDTGAMRQHDGSTHHLIGSLRIDAETKGHFDRFIKLGIGRALHQFYGFLQAI